VVLVRVRQDEHVDRAPPPRHRRTELSERLIGIRTGVDEHAMAGRRDNQDPVALSNVHDNQMQAPIRQGRNGGDGERRGEDQQRASRPSERVEKPVRLRSERLDDGLGS